MINSTRTINTAFFSKREQKKRVFMKNDSILPKDIIGNITKGCEIFGLTKGQTSIIEIIEYILSVTGPSDVVISTWTAAQRSIEKTQHFLKNGMIRDLKFLIDPSFNARKPEFCDDLVEKFGKDCVRTFRNHAKFILIGNDCWNIVIRTSMNLNQNPRMEYVEISDCKEMYDFMNGITDEIFKKIPSDQTFNRTEMTNETILEFKKQEKKSFSLFGENDSIRSGFLDDI